MSKNCKLVRPTNVIIISSRNIILQYDVGNNSRKLNISKEMANRILNANKHRIKQFRDYFKYEIY